MRINSKWEEMKEIAAANNVGYITYTKRLRKGWSYEKAASTPPLPRYIPKRNENNPKPKNPMGRMVALKKIDEVAKKNCHSCRFKNNTNEYCLTKCETGQELQELGKHLTVKPRKKAPAAWE